MTELLPFLEVFELDEGSPRMGPGTQLGPANASSVAVLAKIGGRSFNLGTFRTFTQERAQKWNATLGEIFPAFLGAIECVGFCWDGRIVAETLLDREAIERGVTIFDPGTAGCLNAPMDIVTFLNEAVCDDDEDILDAATYLEWLKVNETPVGYDECIGYQVPLFLGGDASASNMSVIDLDVYWEVTGELIKAYLDAEDGDLIKVRG